MGSIVMNDIPIIDHKSNQLNRLEVKSSKFYKCCPSDGQKCFWTKNNGNQFRKHLERHESVFCSYCKLEGKENMSFDKSNYDQLMDHLVKFHGRRCFQCNQCQYRACTLSHVLLHQISAHFHIWSNNNRLNSYEAIDETLETNISKICKIIVCKNVCDSPSTDSSIWIKEFAPQLEPNLRLNEYHCLFCEFNDEEVTNVLLHCVQSHCDFDVCVYHEECQQNYSLQTINGSPLSIEYNTDNESNDEVIDYETEDMHELEGNPENQYNSECRYNPEMEVEHEMEVNDDMKELPHLEDNHNSPFKKQTYEPYYEEDYGDIPLDVPFEEHLPQMPSDQRSAEKQSRSFDFSSNINSNKSNEHLSHNRNNININSFKRALSFSDMSSPKRRLTSTPNNRQIPPPIGLESIEPQIRSQLNSSNSTNKHKKRVGVSKDTSHTNAMKSNTIVNKKNKITNKITYIPRNDKDSDDEYLELLEEREANIPKRGVKARFENLNFFEPTALPKSRPDFNEKNIFRCLICKIDNLRNNKIEYHLKFVHKTTSSFKCGYCDFIGHKNEIKDHSDLKHPASEVKVEKFVVPKGQNIAIGLTATSSTTVQRPTAFARKKTNPNKGSLMQTIKDSTFMGPLRNDRTEKKRLQSESNSEPQPHIRAHTLAPHSSNIRPKRAPKPTATQTRFAKKSTANRKNLPQNESQISVTIPDEEIPKKHFCLFCSESFLINDKIEAIEHYKTHLNLGYTCTLCKYFVISYEQMNYHMRSVHTHEDSDYNMTDNMSNEMINWIQNFISNQIKFSEFVDNDKLKASNSNGINIECPLCVKASAICKMKPFPFQTLWEAKFHVCKHLCWYPMKCNLCEETIMFPNNPYLLMKHLVLQHFTSADNLYNQSFRGQKAYNDMKFSQMRAIQKYFTRLKVTSSEVMDSLFQQLMDELDAIHQNQLISKFEIRKDIRINVERIITIKSEPNDEAMEELGSDEESSQYMNESIDDIRDDKKDIKIKPEMKAEMKSEIKTEMKSEFKSEVKDEIKYEMKDEMKSHINYMKTLYGDDFDDSNSSKERVSNEVETIDLSSDEN